MPTLRHRNPVIPKQSEAREIYEVDTDEEERITKQQQEEAGRQSRTARLVQNEDEPFISLLDIVRILVTLVLASTALSYYTTSGASLIWGYQRPWFTRWPLLRAYLVRD
jgi:hypothetical protein